MFLFYGHGTEYRKVYVINIYYMSVPEPKTVRVVENKVPLFFLSWPHGLRYDPLVFLQTS